MVGVDMCFHGSLINFVQEGAIIVIQFYQPLLRGFSKTSNVP